MVNWIYCNVGCEGGTLDDHKRMRELLASRDSLLSFNKLKPIPEELVAHAIEVPEIYDADNVGEDERTRIEIDSNVLRDKYGTSDVHTWCLRHWGTELDAENVFRDDATTAPATEYEFRTKWRFPINIIVLWSMRFPMMTLECYGEEDCEGLDIRAIFKNGECKLLESIIRDEDGVERRTVREDPTKFFDERIEITRKENQ